MVLEKLPYPVGSKITAKLNTGALPMKAEIVAFDPKLKVVILVSLKRPLTLRFSNFKLILVK